MERDGAINHVGQAFQLLFTQIHIHYLIMRGHTQTHTIYIYTHCVFGSLHIINTHTTNTVQDGGVKKKKKIEGPITHLIFSHGDPRADPDKARSHI